MRTVWVRKNGKKLFQARALDSFFQKTRGLMFKNRAEPLLFDFGFEGTRRNAIHSLFCPPFDAVFLDSRKRVVCFFKNVRPFLLLLYPSEPARFLLELPPGWAEKHAIRKADKLDWS